MSLPAEFQRIEDGQKQTASAMKACIKEYNATLPAQVKTSGGRDVLLEQLALINPDMVAQEAQKAQPMADLAGSNNLPGGRWQGCPA